MEWDDISWNEFRAFHQVAIEGSASVKWFRSPLSERIMEAELIQRNGGAIIPGDDFAAFHNKEIENLFLELMDFIGIYGLEETNFTISELRCLKNIQQLDSLKVESVSLKELSSRFFGDAKKLKKNSALYHAVKTVCNEKLSLHAESKEQYVKVLHCLAGTPERIILCENQNLLDKKRLRSSELWYAGGNNIAKLKFIPSLSIPYFYLCDWDPNGIRIFQRIKKNYITALELITPRKPILFKPMRKGDAWDIKLEQNLFLPEALELIKQLIREEKWIEEETIYHPFLDSREPE